MVDYALEESPQYRGWLMWELLYSHLNGDYPAEATFGLTGNNEIICTINERRLGTELSVSLPEEKAQKGRWEFEQKSGIGNLTPGNSQEPFVTANECKTLFRGKSDGSISSMLVDLHFVALGAVGRPMRLFTGFIHRDMRRC